MTDLEAITNSFNALSFPSIKGDDLPGIDMLLGDTVREVKRLATEYHRACEEYDTLAGVKRERTAELAEVRQDLNKEYIARIQESVDNPACDLSSISQGLIHLEREVAFRQDGLGFIEYVLFPAASDKKQETGSDLLRAEHLEASLYAARSHATMVQGLERAGLSQTHGRVIAYSETTEKLELVAADCHTRAQQANAELTASRAARLARTQQRHADRMTTKAEAVYSELSRINITETESSTE